VGVNSADVKKRVAYCMCVLHAGEKSRSLPSVLVIVNTSNDCGTKYGSTQ
jgi:hypothetical protein